jgi:hypothetical protein
MLSNSFKYIIPVIVLSLLFSCKKDDNSGDLPTDDDPMQTELEGVIDLVKTYGGSGEDKATAIVRADDGGYVVFGSTKSNDGDIVDKTDTNSDFWALKLTADGEKVWSKTYGGSNDEEGNSIQKTNDGGYILSGYSRSSDGDVGGNEGFQDFWIVKIDGSGTLQWEQHYGFAGGEQCFTAFPTSDGGYFASGLLDVTGSNGQGNDDGRNPEHGVGEFWGIKMDSEGEKQWRRYFGGTNNDRSYDALETDDGGFLLVGASESDDFDITDSRGSYDFWVVRVNADGDKLWTKSFGGSEIDVAYAVTKSADGNYILVGDTRSTDQDVSNPLGNADLWVVKFSDNNGAMIWEKTYGGTEFESAKSINPMANGNYLISGATRSSNGDVTNNNGQNDAWVIIIDEDGELQFEMAVGGSALDFGNDALETTDGKLILVGDTESNDLDISTNRGFNDFLFVRIK